MSHQKTTILHLITTLNVGGAEMMLYKILMFMDRKRYLNYVVSLSDIGDLGVKIRDLGIPVYGLNIPKNGLNIRTLRGFIKLYLLLRAIRPAILQTWLYHADLTGLILGKLVRIKSIYWNVRSTTFDKDQHSTIWIRKLCSLFSPIPNGIIINSKKGKSIHQAIGYKTKKWKVIPNGFDINKFKPDKRAKAILMKELGISESGYYEDCPKKGVFFIGIIARHHPQKDHSTFIYAASKLLEKGYDVHFIMAGKGIEWKNKRLSNRIPSAWRGRFHLLGEREDIPMLTASLDIASSTSYYGEGFSNTLGEAMASGIPCVITDIGDALDIMGNTGIIVPARDPVAIANAWEKIIMMKEKERLTLGQLGRQRIVSLFAIEQITKRYEQIYTNPF